MTRTVGVILTGTPGTGKTTIGKHYSIEKGLSLVNVNDVVGDDYLYLEGDSRVVDLEVLSQKITNSVSEGTVVEGHLAHLLKLIGPVVVLRTHPGELKQRLIGKGFKGQKLWENLEAEALDIILLESLEMYEDVYEVDTTGRAAGEVSGDLEDIMGGRGGEFKPGGVDWLEDYFDMKK